MRYLVAVQNTMTHMVVDVPHVLDRDLKEVYDYIQNRLGGVIPIAFFEADHEPEVKTCHACKGSGIYRSVNKLVEVCTCLKGIGISRQ